MFTMIDESGDIFEYFPKEVPMNGEEIANELVEMKFMKTCTRQHVSAILKRAMNKVYLYYQKHEDLRPFEIATRMIQVFGLNQRSSNEVESFFKLFPVKIRKQIEEDGRKWMKERKYTKNYA